MKLKLSVVLFIILGAFIRFYNLNWGSPLYFHPDERNIASSIVQLSFPAQMNPNFFAYGSFPIYLVYFTGFILNFFLKSQELFGQAILIGRFYSAILSLLIIFSLYFIGRNSVNKKVGILAAVLCTFSVGLIQFAHFGTFEMWLTFLGLWLFYFSLKLLRSSSSRYIVIVGTIFGLLMATKISSLPLLILPIMTVIIDIFSKKRIEKMPQLILKIFIRIIFLIFISLIIFTLFSPYAILDFKSFSSSLQYESSVALGALPVFYTEEFFNSVPVLFQFFRIYPFIISPILTILFPVAFFYISVIGFKKKNSLYLMLGAYYLILFLPQAFLFTKWNRYMIPTLPFIYLIIAIGLEEFLKRKIKIRYYALGILIFINIIFGTSYFITAFVNQDTRIEAGFWAKRNIPAKSTALSETYDLGIVAFNPYLRNISLFNFYELDPISSDNSIQLQKLLSSSEYIILPSQRIIKTRLMNQDMFPNGYNFYNNLMSGKLKYKKVYETSCDIFCKITYLNNPVFSFEETASVFDRPTVFIFKKIE